VSLYCYKIKEKLLETIIKISLKLYHKIRFYLNYNRFTLKTKYMPFPD